MMRLTDLKKEISDGNFAETFSVLYGQNEAGKQTNRYKDALDGFAAAFGLDGETEVNIYSAPGRVEVIGNHTDHQRGKVVAASIHLDALAVVKAGGDTIRIISDGYGEDIIDISDTTVLEDEKHTPASLIRGVAAYFKRKGCRVGGFTAYITSNVLKGSGLSSSAAFETLIGTILNNEYNGGEISAVEIAQAGRFAENVYFGKPCGLMDQMASSAGSTVAIDFFDADNPKIETMEMPLDEFCHTLCVVDTGGNHADLTHEYAAMPQEMKAVASFFGKEVLADVSEEDFTANIAILRQGLGDRAILRAIHFYGENKRVGAFSKALNDRDLPLCLQLLKESGFSSFQYLQNVFSGTNSSEQGLSLALAIAEKALAGRGAYRVHGGGFGGTILVIVPNERLEQFEREICQIFGRGSCHKMHMRPVGAFALKKLN